MLSTEGERPFPSTGSTEQEHAGPRGVAVGYELATETLGVTRWSCLCSEARLSEEKEQGWHTICFNHTGSFLVRSSLGSAMIDTNSISFFNPDSPYQTAHPAGCGDRGSAIVVQEAVLRDIVAHFDTETADRGEALFVSHGCLDPGNLVLEQRLLMRLLAQAPGDALALEERALAIAAGAVRDLFTQQARRNAPVRPSTERFHRERCEATITYMSAHLQEPLQLGTLGRAVGVSPFHLCRVFRRLVGIPIHRYLTRLRLRAGLEAVEEGATDLAAVAAGLGFSSHSHFTSAFGREFGTTPSQLRGRWKELAAPDSRRRPLRPAS